MIITLAEVKEYLRIENDYTEEDELLKSLMEAAEEHLKNATGKAFGSTNNLAKLFVKVLVSDWYENRELTGKQSDKVRGIIQSVLTQLQYCYPAEVEP